MENRIYFQENFVVAMGSINKFLRGKVYNRRRRGHILLSVAIHGLHLEQLFEHNDIQENFIKTNKCQCCPYIEASQLISYAN